MDQQVLFIASYCGMVVASAMPALIEALMDEHPSIWAIQLSTPCSAPRTVLQEWTSLGWAASKQGASWALAVAIIHTIHLGAWAWSTLEAALVWGGFWAGGVWVLTVCIWRPLTHDPFRRK